MTEKSVEVNKCFVMQMGRLTSLLTKQYKMATKRPCGDNQYEVSPLY